MTSTLDLNNPQHREAIETLAMAAMRRGAP